MNVRELMEVLKTCDPEAEVMTMTGEDTVPGLTQTLFLPSGNVEIGEFPNIPANGPKSEGALDYRGKKFVVVCSTTVWGVSPRKRA